ncbi:MAG TPA: AmmeMemoRadiSam system protein A [Candidatus Cloacimonas sp.]|nr:AmmeMemoRadiSam system protein A [Candidatus Cloacimonas sp.]HRR50898.1 AmmeMemoRadiSam system protein A [Candidatus Cloacimonas sp.]
MFTDEQKKELLSLARNALKAHFTGETITLPDDPAFQPKRGVFVSLHINNDLRGCIGYIKGYKPIAESAVEMAEAAAFQDPRFPPLTEKELETVIIEISVLGELIPLLKNELPVIGRDGLYIQNPYGSGILLPQVAVEYNWKPETFLREVCRKAGLPPNAYLEPYSVVFRFTAEVFSEADTF